MLILLTACSGENNETSVEEKEPAIDQTANQEEAEEGEKTTEPKEEEKEPEAQEVLSRNTALMLLIGPCSQ